MDSQGAERRHDRKTWKKEMTQKKKESSERPHLDPTWKRRSSNKIMFAFWRAFEHIACQFLKNQHQICLPHRYIIGQRVFFFLDSCCPVLPLIQGLFSATLSFFLWTPWQEFQAGPTWKKKMRRNGVWTKLTCAHKITTLNPLQHLRELNWNANCKQDRIAQLQRPTSRKSSCVGKMRVNPREVTSWSWQSYTHIAHMIASIVQGWCWWQQHGSSDGDVKSVSPSIPPSTILVQTKNISYHNISITFI